MLRFFQGAFLLWFTLGLAHAQSVSGVITDGETGQLLPGATVLLPTLDLGTTTSIEGRYHLDLHQSGSFRIVFSFVGYKTETFSISVAANEAATLDIVLSPSFVDVGDVTVTAKAQASDVLTTPQSVAVVDENALARSTGGTPMDALDAVAGVRLLRTGPAIAKPVIRGLTSQRVLFVSDGVRQESQGWGDEHGPEIGAADVDRIEVVRGPASLLYGSDALGGVVHTTHANLFADQGAVRGALTATGVSATEQGSADFTLGGGTGRWAYEGRLGILQAGHVSTPSGLILNTAQNQNTGSGRLGRTLGLNGHIVLDAGLFRSKLGIFEPEFLDLTETDLNLGRQEIINPYQKIGRDQASLDVAIPVGSNRLEIVTAIQQSRRQEFGEEEGPAVGSEVQPDMFLRLTTGTLDARFHHRPIGKIFGTVGVSGMWQENETLAEETLIPGAKTLNGGAYLMEELVLPTLTLDAGIRVDARSLDADAAPDLDLVAQTRHYTALTGAVGAAWQPRRDLSISANLGRAFRAPQLIELFGNGVHEGTLRFERGNADLMPERSLALDGVIRYLSPHMYAEVSGFVNEISGYIYLAESAEVDEESGFFIFDHRQTNARLIGGEFRLDIHPHALHGLGLHFSGDLTQGMNRETDTPLPFVPPARFVSAIEYKSANFGGVHDVEMRVGPTFVASQNRPDLQEEIPTAAYTLWDFSLTAVFETGTLTISPVLGVNNVFNASYVDPMSRFRPYGVLAAGRSVRLGVRVDFGA